MINQNESNVTRDFCKFETNDVCREVISLYLCFRFLAVLNPDRRSLVASYTLCQKYKEAHRGIDGCGYVAQFLFTCGPGRGWITNLEPAFMFTPSDNMATTLVYGVRLNRDEETWQIQCCYISHLGSGSDGLQVRYVYQPLCGTIPNTRSSFIGQKNWRHLYKYFALFFWQCWVNYSCNNHSWITVSLW